MKDSNCQRRLRLTFASLGIAAASLLLVGSSAYGQARASFKRCLDRASGDSGFYPVKIDKATTAIGVSCRQAGGRVSYVHDFQLAVKRSAVPKSAVKELGATMRNMICTDPSLKIFLSRVDMEYAYYDSEGAFIDRVTIRIEECRS